MSARYAVGIDLGTTHCAMARVRIDAPDAQTEVLEVAQLVRRGARAERTPPKPQNPKTPIKGKECQAVSRAGAV